MTDQRKSSTHIVWSTIKFISNNLSKGLLLGTEYLHHQKVYPRMDNSGSFLLSLKVAPPESSPALSSCLCRLGKGPRESYN